MSKCKKFCKNIFLPQREQVEIEYGKKNPKLKYNYLKLTKKNKSFAKLMKKGFLKACDDIYCKTKCKKNKKFINSFTKKRKNKLLQQGAISGCRDLRKEFPAYYKNKNV